MGDGTTLTVTTCTTATYGDTGVMLVKPKLKLNPKLNLMLNGTAITVDTDTLDTPTTDTTTTCLTTVITTITVTTCTTATSGETGVLSVRLKLTLKPKLILTTTTLDTMETTKLEAMDTMNITNPQPTPATTCTTVTP